MNVKQLRDHYKVESNPQLAKKLEVGRTTVWDWETKGIPPKTQAFLEIKTQGKLKADLRALTA